jgi:hypothetical protein
MLFRGSPAPMRFDVKGAVAYTAICCAPKPHDWSLKQLNIRDGAATNSEFISRFLHVISFITKHDGGVIYAPNTSKASARISHPDEFDKIVRIGDHIELRGNPEVHSEGTWLRPGENTVYPTGGCPVLVFIGGGHCCVVHAGRDSLIDRERIRSGERSREHESIVHAVIEAFKERGVTQPGSIKVHGYFGLAPRTFDHSFDHPEHGDLNKRLADELNVPGKLPVLMYSKKAGTEIFDIGALVKNQCADCNLISSTQYDHTLERNGPFASTKHPIEKLRDMRNLVVIARTH